MKSKAGSILTLIHGIIISLVVLVAIVASILVFAGVGEPEESESFEGDRTFLGIVLLVIGLFFLIFALLDFWAAKLMKYPGTTTKGGIIALVVGVFTGGINLALIGGIIGIIQGQQMNR